MSEPPFFAYWAVIAPETYSLNNLSSSVFILRRRLSVSPVDLNAKPQGVAFLDLLGQHDPRQVEGRTVPFKNRPIALESIHDAL
jgi:hypothetical protein